MNEPTLREAVIHTGLRLVRAGERLFRGKTPDRNLENLRSLTRFLFFQYETALGSNVHATPVYEALKQAQPNSSITVACRGLGFEVLKHNPFVDHLIQTPDPYAHPLKTARFLRRYLRSQHLQPEAILTNTGNSRRSIALLALLTAKALRLGYTMAPELYHLPVTGDLPESLIATNLRLVSSLGHSPNNLEPRVFFDSKDLAKAEALMSEGGDITRPRIVFITQTSPTQRKSWPVDRFVQVINHALANYDANALFVGTAAESVAIHSLQAMVVAPTVSVAGRTTIPVLAAVLAASDLVVTLDTGNMHVARAVGVPMVILAPAWQPSVEWLPLGFDQYRIFKGPDLPSIPSDYQILEVEAEEVIDTVDTLLGKYCSSAMSRAERVERSLSSTRAT